MTEHIIARAEMLCLAYAVHKAARHHRPSKHLDSLWRIAVARVAALEGRHG